MKAGNLREVIDFEERKLISNIYNEQTTEFTKCKTCRCEIVYEEGTKLQENNELLYQISPTFRIRLYHQINDTMRIVYKGKYYRILSIVPNQLRQEQTIKTELINN